jgi:hypothetical protein
MPPSSPQMPRPAPNPCPGTTYASASARRSGTGWPRPDVTGARKGRNLEHRPECSLAARAPAIDIVIEGVTSWVDDRGLLEQIAAAYDSNYGWPVSITNDNMFEAPYGAPTAGPPPYRSAALSAPWRTPDASYWQQG